MPGFWVSAPLALRSKAATALVTGRALLGLGTACFLMAPLALYARWFAPERFSTIGGIHLGIGSLGALLARPAPVAGCAPATQPAPHVVSRRASAPSLQLPPATLVAAFTLRAPPIRAMYRPTPVCARECSPLLLTCSARGPPIA